MPGCTEWAHEVFVMNNWKSRILIKYFEWIKELISLRMHLHFKFIMKIIFPQEKTPYRPNNHFNEKIYWNNEQKRNKFVNMCIQIKHELTLGSTMNKILDKNTSQ